MRFGLAVCALILGITCAPVSSPRSWTSLDSGLPTHTTILTLAVSPHEPRTIFAGAYDTTGAYISTDQARSWRAINAGLNGASIFVFRFIDDVLFAGTTTGLFRWNSNHWERVVGVPALSVYSVERGMDGAWYLATDTRGIFTSADDGKTWTHIAGLDVEIVVSVAALDARTIFAGTSGHGVFVTRDRGATWHALDAFTTDYVSLITIDPRDHRSVYLRTRGGLFRSRDAGATWQLLLGGIQNELVNAILFDSASARIYAATDSHGVFVSEDDGATWQPAGSSLPQGVAMYALAQLDAQTLLVGAQNGIYLSRDAGNTWQTAREGLGVPQVHALDLDSDTGTLFVATEDGLYQSHANEKLARIGGETIRFPVLSIVTAPSNRQVVYAGTYRHGIFVSRDGGTSWNSVGDIFQNRLSVPGLAVDPQNDQRIYARVLFERIYKSSDSSTKWHAVWSGMPDEAQVTAISFTPGDPTQMFAGTNVGLFFSRDAGELWMPRGLTEQTVFAIWVDPRRLFAGGTEGLYRSDDGGTTWTHIALAHITVSAIVRDRTGSFYIGTKYNGVWTSRDDGKTWTRLGLDGDSITALVTDDLRGILYAATVRGVFKTPIE